MSTVKGKEILIEAKLRGPGPGRYALPTTCGSGRHDFTKQMKPTFSFARQLPIPNTVINTFSLTLTYSTFRFTVRDLSILSKMKWLDSEKTEPPNTLSSAVGKSLKPSWLPDPETTRITAAIHKVSSAQIRLELLIDLGEKHAPKYSMGSRTKYRKCDAYPASNSYELPQLIGPKIPSKTASNAYSMTSRRRIGSFDQDLAKTPGAARFDIIIVLDSNRIFQIPSRWAKYL